MQAACSATKFTATKKEVLSHSVFTAGQSDDGSGLPDYSNLPNLPTIPGSSTSDGTLPIVLYCGTNETGSRMVDSTDITAHIAGPTNCDITDATLKDSIIKNRSIDVNAIAGKCGKTLSDGTYRLTLSGDNALLNSNMASKGVPAAMINQDKDKSITLTPILFMVSGGKASKSPFTFADAYVMSDYNPDVPMMDMTPPIKMYDVHMRDDIPCDKMGSPLVVQLAAKGRRARPLRLGVPENGVLFDLLGANDSHIKHLISWFLPESRRDNYFIALPNASGQVMGIDELFGNNTLGPDGRFAENGFLALSKYDQNGDQRIDSSDAVFTELRLWSDRNGDGIAQQEELFTLEEMDVKFIDLEYDANFLETDRNGNMLRYKSVAVTNDGVLHTIFDIWFRYL